MKISQFLPATLCRWGFCFLPCNPPGCPCQTCHLFMGRIGSTTMSQWGGVNMATCMCVCICVCVVCECHCRMNLHMCIGLFVYIFPFRLRLSLKHLVGRDSKNQQSAKASLKCKFQWASFESLQFFQNNWAAAFWGLNLWSNLRLVSESSLSRCRQNWSAPSDLGVGDRIVLTDAWPAFSLSRFHCLFAFQEQHKAN